MKRCWDPEFESSVEKDHGLSMMYGDSLGSLLWRAHTQGGFPL